MLNKRQLKLTKSSTRVAAGVLLVFGGMSRAAETGLDCCDRFGIFLINVKLKKTSINDDKVL